MCIVDDGRLRARAPPHLILEGILRNLRMHTPRAQAFPSGVGSKTHRLSCLCKRQPSFTDIRLDIGIWSPSSPVACPTLLRPPLL